MTRQEHAALLNDMARQYRETRREEYILPSEKTLNGQEEYYPFRYENVGCGASTAFYYF